MKAYKVEVLIIDFDELGPDEIKLVIKSTKYPNRCISPDTRRIEESDIGEWDDNHPLNMLATRDAEFARLFPLADEAGDER